MTSTLLNSLFELPNDHWYHIVPLGEFHHAESDLLQVIDERAVQSMVGRFQQEAVVPNFPGLLVDFDHSSHHATQPTEAAGWITELKAVTANDAPALNQGTAHHAPGLWAHIRWSDTGAAAVRGGRYRLVSPVWLAEDCEAVSPVRPTSLTCPTSPTPTSLRPLRLHRLALTNDPNLRGMVPLSNHAFTQGRFPEPVAAAASHLSTHPALPPQKEEPRTASHPNQPARSAATLLPTPSLSADFQAGNHARLHPQPKETMKTISVALGLAADAAEEAVLAEIAQIKNRAAQAEARAHTAEQQARELLASQVERDLEFYAARFAPEAREKWKAALLANRAETLALLSSLPTPKTTNAATPTTASSTGPLHHRADAKPPAGSPIEGAAHHRTAQFKAVREYQNRHHCNWQTAWDAVRAETPELFRMTNDQ